MAQLQTLSLKDDNASTVTFVPQNISRDGVARLVHTNGLPIGDEVVTISLNRTPSKFKARHVIHVPTVVQETINGVVVPKVIRNSYVDVQFSYDLTSTLAERQYLSALVSSALDMTQPLMAGTFLNLEGIY